MRYVAKVWVMDVMDQIVISGTVTNADDLTRTDEAPYEFTYQVRGTGTNDPAAWLLGALGGVLRETQHGPSEKG